MRRLSQSLILLALPAALSAQATGPAARTWGAEGSSGSGALLRFRTEAVALVVALGASHTHQSDGSVLGGDQTSISVSLGARRYSRIAERTRPYRTISVEADYLKSGSLTRTGFGVGAEFGAAHFFTPHVSLGASGEFIASVARTKLSSSFSGSSTESTGTSFRFSGFRVLGGVYF